MGDACLEVFETKPVEKFTTNLAKVNYKYSPIDMFEIQDSAHVQSKTRLQVGQTFKPLNP